ncbi:MAG: ABC transporter ATP-binding protein [Actinomycetota bacterium]|nr:ABC transporter ATP-binding protein [Actinomycetota bacterium]
MSAPAPGIARASPLLTFRELTVTFGHGERSVRPVDGVSFELEPGDRLAVVGESGCGKSTLAAAILDVIPSPGRVTGGEVSIDGQPVSTLDRDELEHVRAATVAMVFQSAMNAFNPVLTIGTQVEHILRAHPGVFASQAEGRKHFEYLLELVRLDPARVVRSYESELSGGMKQRVAIAVAVLLSPKLVVLDEPTTALDVWNQRVVISILHELHRTLGIAIMLVTHDLAVVAEVATKVAVMYAGRLVEYGGVDEIFHGQRRHPYVAALIGAIPSVLKGGLTVRPIPGQVPSLAELAPGCRFAPRCQRAVTICHQQEPALLADGGDHLVACHVVNAGELVTGV